MSRPALATILAAAACAGGCLPADMRADPFTKMAQDDLARNDLAACASHASEGIEIRGGWWRDRGVPDLTKVGASALSMKQAQVYEVRAHCLKAQNKLPEAAADMEQAAYFYAGACKTLRPAVDFGNMKETCQSAANAAETAAKWKKEAR